MWDFSSSIDALTTRLSLPPGLTATVVLTAVALVIAIVFMAWTFGLCIAHGRKANLRTDIIARWRPFMLRAMGGDLRPGELSSLGALAPQEVIVLMTLWNQYSDTLRGDALVGLQHVAAGVGMREHALRLAQRGTPDERLIGLMTLGHLAQPDDWASVAPFLDHPSRYVSLASARAMLRLDAVTALPMVLQQFVARHDWPVPNLAMMLTAIDQHWLAEGLTLAAMQLPSVQQVRLLPLLRVTGSSQAQQAFEFLLATSDDAAVLAASLAQIRSPTSRDRVRELIDHPHAQVRAYAVRAMGRFVQVRTSMPTTQAANASNFDAPRSVAAFGGAPPMALTMALTVAPIVPPLHGNDIDSTQDLHLLWGLLSDALPTIRSHAANALVSAPGVDVDMVQRWHATLTDAVARASLEQAWADLMFERGTPADYQLRAAA